MDRRQRKTREAIFRAFSELLSEEDFAHITVEAIIRRADVGRATFYAHFETKDFLLKEMCEELFCHIFDAIDHQHEHRHIFDCHAPQSPFLHLFQHLMKNDNNILRLLSSRNNDLFLQYFKGELKKMIESQLETFRDERLRALPEDFLVNHITATLVETVRWWLEHDMQESPETVTDYFLLAVRAEPIS